MRAANAAGAQAAGVWTRRPDHVGRPQPAEFGQHFISKSELSQPGADILVLSVSDDQIAPLARDVAEEPQGLLESQTLVVHLSGSLSLDVLQPLNDVGLAVAAAHPMRAFPSYAPGIDLRGSYLALEGNAESLLTLKSFSETLGMNCFELPAHAKSAHHLAAAFASNLVMLLMEAVDDLRVAAGVSDSGREAYLDLARRSIELQAELGDQALTGPWLRGDLGTLNRHLRELSTRPGLDGLYRAFADYLLTKSGRIPDPLVFARELRRSEKGPT